MPRAFKTLVDLLHRRTRGPHLVAALGIFLDEVGDKAEKALGLGGIVGEVSALNCLAERWRTVLGEIPFCHTTDFEAGEGDIFEGCKAEDDKKKALRSGMLAAIEEFLHQPYSMAVAYSFRSKDYHRTMGKHFNPEPYSGC